MDVSQITSVSAEFGLFVGHLWGVAPPNHKNVGSCPDSSPSYWILESLSKIVYPPFIPTATQGNGYCHPGREKRYLLAYHVKKMEVNLFVWKELVPTQIFTNGCCGQMRHHGGGGRDGCPLWKGRKKRKSTNVKNLEIFHSLSGSKCDSFGGLSPLTPT